MKIIKITCPECGSILWIDIEKNEVIKKEKSKKELKKELEELIKKEKEKAKQFTDKLETLSEIEKRRKKELEKILSEKLKKNES